MQKITGTVDYFNPATGELTIKDDSGDVKKLKAGPEINMESPNTVVIKVPGIDDTRGFRGSVVDYIAEALGIAL